MFKAGILTSLRLLLLPISRLTNSGFSEDRLIRVTAADTVPDSHRIPYYRFVNFTIEPKTGAKVGILFQSEFDLMKEKNLTSFL